MSETWWTRPLTWPWVAVPVALLIALVLVESVPACSGKAAGDAWRIEYVDGPLGSENK